MKNSFEPPCRHHHLKTRFNLTQGLWDNLPYFEVRVTDTVEHWSWTIYKWFSVRSFFWQFFHLPGGWMRSICIFCMNSLAIIFPFECYLPGAWMRSIFIFCMNSLVIIFPFECDLPGGWMRSIWIFCMNSWVIIFLLYVIFLVAGRVIWIFCLKFVRVSSLNNDAWPR